MKLPDTEHTARPWRIHEITPDFRLEDVWAYRTPGAGPDDFPVMLDALRYAGGLNENPPVVRFLFDVRWKVGALFGWDKPRQGLVGRVGSLCDRVPSDLRQDAAGEAVPNTPFTMVYELPDECAIELANKTVTTSVTWAGCRPRPANTRCGWRPWSSPTACSDLSTWPRSNRFAT